MTAILKAVAPVPFKGMGDTKSIREQLAGRESKELVIAFSGALGAGINNVRPIFENELRLLNYKIVEIKVSSLIRQNAQRMLDIKAPEKYNYKDINSREKLDRYKSLQDAGNSLRAEYTTDILAQLVVHFIATHDTRIEVEQEDLNKVPNRVAFIVDQLKHYDEVKFLRDIYANNFYQIGILSGRDLRLARVIDETKADAPEVSKIIDRDREDEDDHGQQLDRTLKLSDFFIRHSSGNKSAMEGQARRFVKLIHGAVDITPSKDEFGMYVAFSSGLASACMSRQVGAAILNLDGAVLSTGCNDVPRAGGGLYSDISKPDFRCVMKTEGICHNDAEKDQIRDEISSLLVRNGIELGMANSLAKQIRKETRLKDLIEFSRAVHAEMDALISVSRKGSGSVIGATLYTTTYPCHNCARHILASGIGRVYFIEPYEKSLAIKLHADAIVHDIDPEEITPSKVPFLHFEGVAPRRYQDLFLFSSGRKSNGKRVSLDLAEANKKIPQMLDGYRIIEKKVLQSLKKQMVITEERDE